MEAKVKVSHHRTFVAEIAPLKVEASENVAMIVASHDMPSMCSMVSVRKEHFSALKALLAELELFWAGGAYGREANNG